MPNHVTHKITFDRTHAESVFSAVCPNGTFSFEPLIPQPPHLYHGNLSREDQADFKCNWLSWNTENWGTKWDAYMSSCGETDDGQTAFIQFDTAWSVPYPALAAFANKCCVPFVHRYFDEGHNFWGVEEWGCEPHGDDPKPIVRLSKRRDDEADKVALCIELKGYDPREERE
jgi:hypothetical protein